MMFDPNTVYFGKGRRTHVSCPTRGQAELVARLASLGVSDDVKLPKGLAPALKVLDRINVRHAKAVTRFRELAASRTGDERVQTQLIDVVERWFVLGREEAKTESSTEEQPKGDELRSILQIES